MSDFNLFHCVLSSKLPWQSIGRSNIYRGLHNLIMLITKRKKKTILRIESTVDIHKKTTYISIYVYESLCIVGILLNQWYHPKIILLFAVKHNKTNDKVQIDMIQMVA